MKLTQERLKELLHYDPDTGIFTWKVTLSIRQKAGTIAGNPHSAGYITICFGHKPYLAHRLVFLYIEGYMPEQDVDHINGIKNDNRWGNLRHVSPSCNNRNRSNHNSNNTTGITGVSPHRNKFAVQIGTGLSKGTYRQKYAYIGAFKTFEEAVRKRWEAEKKYNYPTCRSTSPAYLWLKERGLIEEVKCNVKRGKDSRLSESCQQCFDF